MAKLFSSHKTLKMLAGKVTILYAENGAAMGSIGIHSVQKKELVALLTAAPDLLAALEQAYLDAVTFLNDGDFKRKVEWDASYIQNAIDKAKGKS